MYTIDTENAHLLLEYTDVFSDKMPNLQEELKNIHMHKAISIICELIRVRDKKIKLYSILPIPYEIFLKIQMCGIESKSPEELFTNPLMKKNVHIISVQMLLILLKKIIQFGNYETMSDTHYEITKEDYKKVIRLQ